MAATNWFFSANLPIGQIYHVGLSNENPYTVCVGLQDNNGWCGPSNSLDPPAASSTSTGSTTVGGDGEWVGPRSERPEFDLDRRENGALQVYNQGDAGLVVGQTLYRPVARRIVRPLQSASTASTGIRRSRSRRGIAHTSRGTAATSSSRRTDRGKHWTVISPDLTRNVKAHQTAVRRPITHDVSGAEYTDTILDIEGSTLRQRRDLGRHRRRPRPAHARRRQALEERHAAGTRRRSAASKPSRRQRCVAGTAYAGARSPLRRRPRSPTLFVTHDFGAHVDARS